MARRVEITPQQLKELEEDGSVLLRVSDARPLPDGTFDLEVLLTSEG